MYTICIYFYFYIQDIHMFKLYTYMYIGMYKLYMQIHISIHLSSFCSLAEVDALVTQCLQQLDAIFSALGEVRTAGTQTWAMDEKKLRQAFNCWRWGWEKRRNADRMWFILNIWQIMWVILHGFTWLLETLTVSSSASMSHMPCHWQSLHDWVCWNLL